MAKLDLEGGHPFLIAAVLGLAAAAVWPRRRAPQEDAVTGLQVQGWLPSLVCVFSDISRMRTFLFLVLCGCQALQLDDIRGLQVHVASG